jgi:N-terminal domain of anti-restriction factor ArdC
VKPWKSGAKGGIMPYNAVTGRQYRGINIPILWHARQTRGYPTAGWLTYRQALPLDAYVRKGEVGTTVVFTRQLTIKESKEDDEAQIEGLPKTSQAELIEYTDKDALAFINATRPVSTTVATGRTTCPQWTWYGSHHRMTLRATSTTSQRHSTSWRTGLAPSIDWTGNLTTALAPGHMRLRSW